MTTPPNLLTELAERGRFNGMQVIVSRPTISYRQRDWKERWLTIPWRPWLRKVSVLHPAAVATGECYRIGNTLHCGEQFYDRLRASVASEASHD